MASSRESAQPAGGVFCVALHPRPVLPPTALPPSHPHCRHALKTNGLPHYYPRDGKKKFEESVAAFRSGHAAAAAAAAAGGLAG